MSEQLSDSITDQNVQVQPSQIIDSAKSGKSGVSGVDNMSGNQDCVDTESAAFLKLLEEQEKVRANRIPSVSTVLVILSARGMVYDREALRQKILLTYPDATVFFRTTLGKPVGAESPRQVDLLIDLTGPRQRQKLGYARKLRRMARVAIGRNAGIFRKRIYDRIFDEKAISSELPLDPLKRERLVQKEVLAMAGIPISQTGDTPPDRGFSIALELPRLK